MYKPSPRDELPQINIFIVFHVRPPQMLSWKCDSWHRIRIGLLQTGLPQGHEEKRENNYISVALKAGEERNSTQRIDGKAKKAKPLDLAGAYIPPRFIPRGP